jgi:hypothetical protein
MGGARRNSLAGRGSVAGQYTRAQSMQYAPHRAAGRRAGLASRAAAHTHTRLARSHARAPRTRSWSRCRRAHQHAGSSTRGIYACSQYTIDGSNNGFRWQRSGGGGWCSPKPQQRPRTVPPYPSNSLLMRRRMRSLRPGRPAGPNNSFPLCIVEGDRRTHGGAL